METTVKTRSKKKIGYSQVFELVSQLPETDMQQLLKQLQIKFEIPIKKKSQTSIQELILQAPTWTDEEYSDYLETKEYINQSRLK